MRKIIHGECLIASSKIPAEAKKVTNGDHIIADSETEGNFHMVAVKDGVDIYEHEGTLFIRNEVETEIYCPDKTRHDTVVLPEGEWEIDIAKEFDYLADEERQVRD